MCTFKIASVVSFHVLCPALLPFYWYNIIIIIIITIVIIVISTVPPSRLYARIHIIINLSQLDSRNI